MNFAIAYSHKHTYNGKEYFDHCIVLQDGKLNDTGLILVKNTYLDSSDVKSVRYSKKTKKWYCFKD